MKAICGLTFLKSVLRVIAIKEKLQNSLKMKAFHDLGSTKYCVQVPKKAYNKLFKHNTLSKTMLHTEISYIHFIQKLIKSQIL